MDNKHQKEYIKSYISAHERTKALIKNCKTWIRIINNSYAIILVNSKDITDPKNIHVNGVDRALVEKISMEIVEESLKEFDSNDLPF